MASAIDRLRAKLADVANPEEFLDGLGLSSAQCILKDYGKDRGIHPALLRVSTYAHKSSTWTSTSEVPARTSR